MQGWIKLDRNILKWGWYTNGNTFRVFLHLLLTANIEDSEFDGKTIRRGEVVTSYSKIAPTLKLSYEEVRTAFCHLKSTGEITITRYSKYIVVTIVNYNEYQSTPTQNPAISPNQSPIKAQSLPTHNKNIRIKELKNIYNTRTREGFFSGFIKTAAHNFNSRSDINYDDVFCNEVEAL